MLFGSLFWAQFIYDQDTVFFLSQSHQDRTFQFIGRSDTREKYPHIIISDGRDFLTDGLNLHCTFPYTGVSVSYYIHKILYSKWKLHRIVIAIV